MGRSKKRQAYVDDQEAQDVNGVVESQEAYEWWVDKISRRQGVDQKAQKVNGIVCRYRIYSLYSGPAVGKPTPILLQNYEFQTFEAIFTIY